MCCGTLWWYHTQWAGLMCCIEDPWKWEVFKAQKETSSLWNFIQCLWHFWRKVQETEYSSVQKSGSLGPYGRTAFLFSCYRDHKKNLRWHFFSYNKTNNFVMCMFVWIIFWIFWHDLILYDYSLHNKFSLWITTHIFGVMFFFPPFSEIK